MSEDLFGVARIENGWLVTVWERHANNREVFCATWEEVEQLGRRVAFPYPNKGEPRGPKPSGWKPPPMLPPLTIGGEVGDG